MLECRHHAANLFTSSLTQRWANALATTHPRLLRTHRPLPLQSARHRHPLHYQARRLARLAAAHRARHRLAARAAAAAHRARRSARHRHPLHFLARRLAHRHRHRHLPRIQQHQPRSLSRDDSEE